MAPIVRVCAVDGCRREHWCRGFCTKHYQRFMKHGDALYVHPRFRSAEERFMAKVDQSGDCWLWTGSQQALGYGEFTSDPYRKVLAHRWSYEHFVGPIPPKFDVRAACGDRLCVRPDHLQALSRRDALRARHPEGECRRGHRLTDTLVRLRNGEEVCRLCRQENYRTYWESGRGRDAGREKRARRRKAYAVERLVAVDVYERDGWICQLCGDPIDPTLRRPDVMCVSLDHIVPLSKGGAHTYDNVQAAHLRCNSAKGNRV